MTSPFERNTLYYGDNLPILRDRFPDASIDLIYLDPPFNSNRSYNILFKDETGGDSEAQITAFDDAWHWGQAAEETYRELATGAQPRVASMISALRDFVGTNQMMAYLVMMAARLVELHRVLKPTGSLYLHCDPTASHYLKVILDTIFGPENFQNEISWRRSGRRSSIKKVYRRAHDVVFFYTKSDSYTYNIIYEAPDDTLLNKYTQEDQHGKYQLVPLLGSGRVLSGATGQVWRGFDPNTRGIAGMHWLTTPDKLEEYVKQGLVVFPKKPTGFPRLKYYLSQNKGVPISDYWDDIDLINSMGNESLGYPTQKPLALLERIIQASSNPGDLVLDPFCGCGTAIAAAQKLSRRWIGIDITHLAIALQKYRLEDAFGPQPGKDYQVLGEPEDLASARQLASDDRYQFQWWALSLIRAKPLGSDDGRTGKKGSDRGIDGVINFLDGKDQLRKVIIQVKSGKVNSGDIRDLKGAVDQERAAMGLFVTLEKPSREMEIAAISAGFYTSLLWDRNFPLIQIVTIEQLLDGRMPDLPPIHGTFKKADRIQGKTPTQNTLDL